MREGVREGERGCERVIASLRMYTVGHMQAREIRGRSEGDQRWMAGWRLGVKAVAYRDWAGGGCGGQRMGLVACAVA